MLAHLGAIIAEAADISRRTAEPSRPSRLSAAAAAVRSISRPAPRLVGCRPCSHGGRAPGRSRARAALSGPLIHGYDPCRSTSTTLVRHLSNTTSLI